jgi:hypothetical protein
MGVEVNNEQNHEVVEDVRPPPNSWENINLIDEAAKSGLEGLSMPVDEGGSKEMKKESRQNQVEVIGMEQGMIVEV